MSACTQTPDPSAEVSILLRSAGERTESLCRILLAEQAAAARIQVVREKPFARSLARSFELGRDAGLPWTLCVDADMLLAPGTLRICLARLRSAERHVFGVSAYVWDKFYDAPKLRGLHLYRTHWLDKALALVETHARALRPETAVKQAMEVLGHPWLYLDEVVALHDFEQYHADIFRKTATRAQKNPDHLSHLLALADAAADRDPDLRVMAAGLRFGASLARDQVALHADQWRTEAQATLARLGLSEKTPLAAGTWSGRAVADRLCRLQRRRGAFWRWVRAGRQRLTAWFGRPGAGAP